MFGNRLLRNEGPLKGGWSGENPYVHLWVLMYNMYMSTTEPLNITEARKRLAAIIDQAHGADAYMARVILGSAWPSRPEPSLQGTHPPAWGLSLHLGQPLGARPIPL